MPIVAETIERGQLRWNSTDGWRFAMVRDGVRFVVVVSDTDTVSPVLVTGWTEVADWETAVGSNRWSRVDVETIRLRADLSADRGRRVPQRIRPREVTRPFEIGGHRVHTVAGDAFVTCADCDRQFRSKEALCECRCRD